MTIQQLPSGRWRAQVRRKYVQLDKTFDTEVEARAAEQSALKKQKPEELTLAVAWIKYVESTDFLDKAAATKKTEHQRMRYVLADLGAYALVALEKEPRIIKNWIESRKKRISDRTGKRVSSASVRLELAAMASVVNYAVDQDMVTTNFLATIKRPVTPNRRRRLDADEQGQLAIYARNEEFSVAQAARFLLLIRHLGCRPGELSTLRLKQVHLDRREVHFSRTKNGEDRRAHATKDARELIALQLAEKPTGSPLLFGTWSPRQKSWVAYNYPIGVKRLRELGVIEQSYHAHAGRREFVSRAIEQNLPLTTIKKQTGHKSVQALEIYDQGLSTAPEIRAELDRLAEVVRAENLLGALRSLGLTEEQEKRLHERFTGQSEWVQPFKD